jgi:hypothetical protein
MPTVVQRRLMVINQGGGGVTAVTASAPLAITGAPATPNVIIAPGTAPGDVLVWNGLTWVPTPGVGGMTTLQAAYDNLNTILVIDAKGSVAISTAAGSTVAAETITTDAGASGAALEISNNGTGNALLVKDGVNAVVTVGPLGGVVIKGSNNGVIGSAISITGGTGPAGAGGNVAIFGGPSTAGGQSGNATLQGGGGVAAPAGFNGGTVSALGGQGGAGAAGGAATFAGGNHHADGTAAGAVTVRGGDTQAIGVGACDAGAATLRGGDAVSPTTGVAGVLTLRGGDHGSGGAAVGTPGGVTIRGGNTLSTTGPGAFVTVNGGNAAGSSGVGGDVTVTGGTSLTGKPGHTKLSTSRGADNVVLNVVNGPVLTLEQTGTSGASVAMFAGTIDPSLPTGVTASEGSLYLRSTAGTGELYVKSGALDTDWTRANGDGDVVGPASATDNAIARFDLTTGKLIQNSLAILDDFGNIDNISGVGAEGKYNGVRHYLSAATDPVLPVPADGDRYWNTALEKEMRYDGSRAKWLSVESAVFTFSRTATAAGSYFRAGEVTMAAAQGWNMPYNGTIIAMGLVRSNAALGPTLQAHADGVSIASLLLVGAALKAKSVTTNANIAVDAVLAAFNLGGGALVNNGIGYFIVKWRV